MWKRMRDAWRGSRDGTLTTSFVGKSEYLAAVDEAFGPIIREYSLQRKAYDYSTTSFGNFVVHFKSPVIELRVIRDRGCCGLEIRPLGSTSDDDWVSGGFLLQLAGAETAGEMMNASPNMTLLELASTMETYFREITQMFEPSNRSDMNRRLQAIYAGNAARLRITSSE